LFILFSVYNLPAEKILEFFLENFLYSLYNFSVFLVYRYPGEFFVNKNVNIFLTGGFKKGFLGLIWL